MGKFHGYFPPPSHQPVILFVAGLLGLLRLGCFKGAARVATNAASILLQPRETKVAPGASLLKLVYLRNPKK